MPRRDTITDTRFAHRGSRALFERDRARGLPPNLVPRIRRIPADLEVAERPGDLDLRGYRLHPLRGDRAGQWSIRVSANRRIVFRFDGAEAVDVELTDYH